MSDGVPRPVTKRLLHLFLLARRGPCRVDQMPAVLRRTKRCLSRIVSTSSPTSSSRRAGWMLRRSGLRGSTVRRSQDQPRENVRFEDRRFVVELPEHTSRYREPTPHPERRQATLPSRSHQKEEATLGLASPVPRRSTSAHGVLQPPPRRSLSDPLTPPPQLVFIQLGRVEREHTHSLSPFPAEIWAPRGQVRRAPFRHSPASVAHRAARMALRASSDTRVTDRPKRPLSITIVPRGVPVIPFGGKIAHVRGCTRGSPHGGGSHRAGGGGRGRGLAGVTRADARWPRSPR